MSSPVTPSEFANVIPSSSGSVCDKFQKAYRTFPQRFSQWYSYVYKEDGTFTDEFKRDICGIDCTALPDSGGSGTGLNVPQVSNGATDAASIRISWTAINGAAFYEVVRNIEDDLYNAEFIGFTTDTTYVDSTVTGNSYYFYWVRARSSTATSGFSAGLLAFVAPGPFLLLPAPVVTATEGAPTEYVSVTWPIVRGATQYGVYRGPDTDIANATLLATTKELFFNDFYGVPSTSYYYFVRANNKYNHPEDSTGDLGSR